MKKPSNAVLFHKNFDQTYKASPNRVDRNAIYACIEQGLTPEETAMKVRVKLKSVKTYFPSAEEAAKKARDEANAKAEAAKLAAEEAEELAQIEADVAAKAAEEAEKLAEAEKKGK